MPKTTVPEVNFHLPGKPEASWALSKLWFGTPMPSIPPIPVFSSQSVLSLHFLQEPKWKPFLSLSDYLDDIYVILNQNIAILPGTTWTPRIIVKVCWDVRFKTRFTSNADGDVEHHGMDGPGQAMEFIPRKACLCLQATACASGKGASQSQKTPQKSPVTGCKSQSSV